MEPVDSPRSHGRHSDAHRRRCFRGTADTHPHHGHGVSVVTGNARVGAQGQLFSAGDAYERFMGRRSRELAPLLVKCAGVRDGDAVLDVGSGTGALTAAVVVAALSSRVIGIDPAELYVAFARTRHPGDLVSVRSR